MAYKLNPLGQRVACVVRRMPEKVGRIYVPDSVREGHHAAEADVIEVGPDVKTLKAGDHIIFNEFTGAEIELEGTWYKLMREEDVLAVIKTK